MHLLIKSKINTNCQCIIKKQRQHLTPGQVWAKIQSQLKRNPALAMNLVGLAPCRLFGEISGISVMAKVKKRLSLWGNTPNMCTFSAAQLGELPKARTTWNKSPAVQFNPMPHLWYWYPAYKDNIHPKGSASALVWAQDESYMHSFMMLSGPVCPPRVVLRPSVPT